MDLLDPFRKVSLAIKDKRNGWMPRYFHAIRVRQVKVHLLARIPFSLPPCPNKNGNSVNVADVTKIDIHVHNIKICF
jgi:hypothetical protein